MKVTAKIRRLFETPAQRRAALVAVFAVFGWRAP